MWMFNILTGESDVYFMASAATVVLRRLYVWGNTLWDTCGAVWRSRVFSPSLPNNLFCSASCIHWQMFLALGIYPVKGNRCKGIKMPAARNSKKITMGNISFIFKTEKQSVWPAWFLYEDNVSFAHYCMFRDRIAHRFMLWGVLHGKLVKERISLLVICDTSQTNATQ